MPPFSAEEIERISRNSFVERVEYSPVITSTNDRALELAQQPHLESPLLVLTEEQTAGRGRGANRWWSAPGAVIFSLLFEPGLLDLPAATWPRVAIVTGLTLCELFREIAPQVKVSLKWPNDVWLEERKVAGILVEVPPARYPLPQRLIVGVGVNVLNSWQQAPEELRHKGIALCDVWASPPSRGEFLLHFLQQFQQNLHKLATSPADLVPRWQGYCALTGRNVQIQQGERIISGKCQGIDSDGALLLSDQSGTQRLFGGVVVSFDGGRSSA